MDNNIKSLLIALVLGDGYIKINKLPNVTHYRLALNHSEKQLEYIVYKKELCESLLNTSIKLHKYLNKGGNYHGVTIKPSNVYQFTVRSKYFKVLRNWMYPNGVKEYRLEYLKYLTPQGLAIWYMDDGSIYRDKKSLKTFSCTISTHASKEEADILLKYFKEYWNVEFHTAKRANDKYNIRCYCKEAYKFIKIIEQYIIPSMKYKIKMPDYYYIHDNILDLLV